MRLWQLEIGAGYVLEAGPADGLGEAPTAIEQTVDFDIEHLGDGVTFDVPGRTVYALRITQTDPPVGVVPPLADLAVAPRDVTYDDESDEIAIRVHNIGAADASAIVIAVYQGLDDSGPLIDSTTLDSVEAPLDLVPRFEEVRIAYVPSATPAAVTIVIDSENAVDEITEENNVASAWIGGAVPDQPPPMILGFESTVTMPGSSIELVGRNMLPGVEVRVSESPTSDIVLTWVDSEHATLEIDLTAPPGLYLVSLENPDGKRSNLVPLTVAEP
jgi:hypothetical protein